MIGRRWTELSNQEQNEALTTIEKLWREVGLDVKDIAEHLDICRYDIQGIIAKYIMTDEEADEFIKEYMEEMKTITE